MTSLVFVSPPPPVAGSVRRTPGDTLPELELIKIIGFVMVVACHFWVIHALPRIFGLAERTPGMGIDASSPSHIDLAAWFPAFPDGAPAGLYTFFNVFFGFGYQGVGVFFILTGFGLTLSALRKPRLDPWTYALGRFERIYLPYVFLLLFVTVVSVVLWGRHHLDLRALVLMDTGIPYAWFLFPLLQFYLVFPFLFLLVRARRLTPTGLLGGAVALNFAWAFGVLFAAYNFMPILAEVGACAPKGLLPFRIAEPIYGMWLAFLYHQNRERFAAWFAPRQLGLFGALYVLGCAFSLAETHLRVGAWTVPLAQSLSNALVSVGLFGLLYLFARAAHRVAARAVPLARYGLEFYLLQSLPLAALAAVLPRFAPTPAVLLALLAAVLVANLLLAMTVHHAIDGLLIRTYHPLKRWLIALNAPAPVAAHVAPALAQPASTGLAVPAAPTAATPDADATLLRLDA